MSIAMLFIIGLSTLQIVITLLYIAYYQKWVTKMCGMLISMALGMSSGILMGTIVGVIFQGNIFVSTFSSILIGITVGFVAGMPGGLAAVIDGVLSGLMGGMMGAMLGEMVAMEKADITIKLLAYLITMILLIVLYTAENSIQEQSGRPVFTFFKYPFLLIFLVTIIFLGLDFVESTVMGGMMK